MMRRRGSVPMAENMSAYLAMRSLALLAVGAFAEERPYFDITRNIGYVKCKRSRDWPAYARSSCRSRDPGLEHHVLKADGRAPSALFWKRMIRTRRAFDPHSIKLVIFDLDGTLIDSRLDLVHSVNAALRHIGRPELPDDVIASYVGDGAPILIQRALGGEIVDEAVVRKGLEFFLSYYREHKLDHTTVYAGIAEALAAIQRFGTNGECPASWRCFRTSR